MIASDEQVTRWVEKDYSGDNSMGQRLGMCCVACGLVENGITVCHHIIPTCIQNKNNKLARYWKVTIRVCPNCHKRIHNLCKKLPPSIVEKISGRAKPETLLKAIYNELPERTYRQMLLVLKHYQETDTKEPSCPFCREYKTTKRKVYRRVKGRPNEEYHCVYCGATWCYEENGEITTAYNY